MMGELTEAECLRCEGKGVVLVCPKCSWLNPPSTQYCLHCRVEMRRFKEPPARLAGEGEDDGYTQEIPA